MEEDVMSSERWVVQSKLRGDFVISDGVLTAPAHTGQLVQKLSLTPEFDESDKYTGLHLLEVDIDIENTCGDPLASDVVFRKAMEAAEYTASVVSLSTGRRVRVEATSVKHRLRDDPVTYRVVIGRTQAASIAPPSMFDPALLTIDLDAKTRRVIRWWSRGVSTEDGVYRLSSFTTALDLLAGTQKDVPGRTRKCKACGNTEEIGPGLKERVKAFLTGDLGYDESTAEDVYASRIDLAHGRSDLTEKDLIRFRTHASLLENAVRDGLAKRLGIVLSAPPEALPFDLPSALLDVEYHEPTDK
jgi:hypothetical protein